jgi:V/A-type H+-transporting ATPase subunit I
MIVPMRQITLLTTSQNRKRALRQIRKLGALHLRRLKTQEIQDIQQLQSKKKDFNNVFTRLKERFTYNKSKLLSSYNQKLIEEKIKQAKEFIDQQQLLSERQDKLLQELSWYQEWGYLNPRDLELLKKYGVRAQLHIISGKRYQQVKNDNVFPIKRVAGKVYCVEITYHQQSALGPSDITLPSLDYHATEQKYAAVKKQLHQIDKKLNQLARDKKNYLRYQKYLNKQIEFLQVDNSLGEQAGIVYLQGFCPLDKIKQLRKSVQENGWGLVVQEPASFKEVPTLLRNPRWLKIIQPVFDFMGTLPGYKEYDVSLWFLVFFSLFFAMIIGDAGYGLILVLGTYLMQRKLKISKLAILLLYVLSISTVVWGALSGSWFGVQKITQLPVFNSLIIDNINAFVQGNQSFIIYLCFIIGAAHLTIAHGIVGFRYLNSLFSLSQLGWIVIIWGLFFVAGNLVLNKAVPFFTPWLLISGTILVLMFSNPQKNILKGALQSLADFPLTLVNSFSDIISYLRLFAVGYASLMLATAVNEMASGVGFGLLAALVLFAGHLLNILLGLMSVLVHGLRLNMLEFSNHLNMEWSGKKYDPFRE